MKDRPPIHILLVEDDPGFQLLIKRILGRLEIEVDLEVVDDGSAALRETATRNLDLVLLDYSLPGENGLEVLAKLKERGAGVPVVMVTGMGNESVAVNALKLGAYDYLVKSSNLKTALPLVVKRVVERVRLEDGLRRYSEENRRLREIDRLKSRFIANVSHELRTPLVSIAGYTELLMSGNLGTLSPKQKHALDVCTRNAERLRTLIDNLLSLSSLEAGRVKPALASFDLVKAVRQTIEATGLDFNDGEIAVAESYPENCPPVVGDPRLIDQVLINIVGNAAKFTPKGGRVEIAVESLGDRVMVRCRDTGIGISKEQTEQIFSRFWQADPSTTRKYPGLGIGLAIVKEIMEAHGTSVKVESTPGEGASFSFSLPVAKTGTEGTVRTPAPAVKENEDAVILVVDDEADTREFVKTALEMAGYQVLLAEDGRAALNVLESTSVDLVLLDIAMHGLSGVDVLKAMRRHPRLANVPVVLLTAISDRATLDSARSAGVAKVLEKPVKTSHLLRSVEEVVR